MAAIEAPEVGKLVRVRIRDWKTELSARVEQLTAERCVLSAPTDGRTTYEVPIGMPIEVGWLTYEGIAWTAALVVDTEPADARSLVVYLLDRPVLFPRREHMRAKVALAIEVRSGSDAEPISGTTIDLGGGGLRARVPVAPPIEDVVRITVHLPGDDPVELTGRVARRVDAETLVFEYELIAPADRDRLIGFAFARVREEFLVDDRTEVISE